MKRKILNEILETSKVFLVALLISLLIKNNVLAAAEVPTGSMETTVMTGSRIMINRLAYVFGEPERGDIVSFYAPDKPDELYLKRILGLPGETIEGIDGIIYIDGKALEHDYTNIIFENDFGPFEIPENSYFMIGDNRNNSRDSRYWNNSYVKKSEIIGQAIFEFYPTVKLLTN